MLVGAERRHRAALIAVGLIASIGAVGAAPSIASASGFSCASGPSYDVVRGDSWFWIADKVDVSVTKLLDANEATADDLLLVGDRLCLPGGTKTAAGCGQKYTVRSGDGWYRIADRSGVSVSALTAANGVTLDAALHPGREVCLPNGATSSSSSSTNSSSSSKSGASYTVTRGDSWSAIADRAGVSLRALLSQNDASAGNLIVPGQVLRLPAGATQPSTVDTSPVVLAAAATQGPCGYVDTWGQARSATRRHQGVDIFSGDGAYVYAVVDGRLTGRVWDGAGRNAGNAWTLTGADDTRFFYAHLSDFAPGLSVGSTVRAGQIIGWIGETGNASAPHLHLEMRPRGGAAVNPYPTLRAQGGGCNDGRPYQQPGGWIPD